MPLLSARRKITSAAASGLLPQQARCFIEPDTRIVAHHELLVAWIDGCLSNGRIDDGWPRSVGRSSVAAGLAIPSENTPPNPRIVMNFRVDLEVFRGPLDLLLYLVRKHEVDIVEIPITPITEQFLEYLAVLEQLDIDAVGDFVDMASMLIEIKSRMLLPRGGEVEEELQDPRQELVRRLLEYKKFKDAASMLDERSRDWQQRYPRLSDDLPPRRTDPAEQQIREVELWDLVSAFGRVMRDNQAAQPSSVVYDETPIHVYMERIHDELRARGRLSFSDLFQRGMHKSSLIGIFLAVLELVRHHQVHTEQGELFGTIWILEGDRSGAAIDFSAADNYEHGKGETKE